MSEDDLLRGEWHEYDCGSRYGDKPHWHPAYPPTNESPPLVVVTVSTRHPDKWELIDHETGEHWRIVDGNWRRPDNRR